MYKALTWIALVVGGLFLLLGIVGALIPQGMILVSPRGCTILSQLFLLAALNFSLLRLIGLKEGSK